jgi:teichoic acid transport system permease protein
VTTALPLPLDPGTPGAPAGRRDADLTAEELAAKYGLTPSSVRPGPLEYLGQLWQRRHFVWAFAHARITSMYVSARLGQVWHVLTPLLSIGVYYFVFGILLNSKGGSGGSYISFLSVGMFVFTYSREAISQGTKSIADRIDLIRAVHFPRVTLPIATTIIQLEQLVFSMGVVIGILLCTGEQASTRWLCLIPALALQTVFNNGMAMFMSRVGARVHDMGELVPFILRTWMYTCGVFYSISHVTEHGPVVIRLLLEWNPGAVYIELARYALLDGYQQVPRVTWLAGGMWAVAAAVVGYLWCWQAEDRYGRG